MAKKDAIVELSAQYWDGANPSNKELAEEYLASAVHLSPKSKLQYQSALRIYIAYINKFCDNKHVTEMKSLDFMKYQNYLLTQGVFDSAIKVKRSVVSNLNEHIILYHGDEYSTFRNFVTKAVKIPQTGKVYEKVPLTDEEYLKLCGVLEDKEDWQKLAWLKFSYVSGCRRNESRQLFKEVVGYAPVEKMAKFRDKDGKEVTAPIKKYKTNLIKCKGKISDAPRRLSFDEDTLKYLMKWLEIRGEDDCPYMFVTNKQTPRQVGENVFNDWCKGFEDIIGRRIHPHLLRASRATSLALSGTNVEAIKNLLGHKNSTTTQIYICVEDDNEEDEIFS